MLYTDFVVGEKTYKLRLSTRSMITLEKRIGMNPLMIFGNGDTLPTVTTMVDILFVSLQEFNHGITLEDAYEIFDKYIEDGHNTTDFIQVILDIYRTSGLLKSSKEQTEKN